MVIVFLLSLLALPVYLDLWVVNRYNTHVFTPILRKLDKSKLKKY